MKYKWEDFKKKFMAWLQPILDYIDSFLNTKPKKIMFGLAVVASILLSAYMIAVFDVGYELLRNKKNMFSIPEMFSLYWSPRYQYPWGVLLVFTLAILLIAALIIYKYGYPTGGRNFKVSRSDVYGSSKELTRKELEKVAVVTDKMATTKTILGQFDAIGKEVIAAKPASTEGSIIPNDNMLVFGPPGSGKSTSYVLPFIAQAILRRHSVIASDTKGEVYAKTVELARRHGYKVLRLDLKDPEHSDGWNVLRELRHDDVRSLVFAQTVMANTNSEGSKDIHASAEESLLNAVCLYTERMPDLDDSQRTFYHAYQMLLQGAENLDAMMTAAFNQHGACMQVVMDAYSTFLNGSQNLRGNIISGLTNRLRILSSPPIRRLTSTDDIVFEDIGKEPTILYLSLSDQHAAMKFLASLTFSFAFQDLVALADRSPGQRLPIPVHFMMEEFGSIGYVPNIDRSLSTARSRGISINIVIQTLAQLMETYEENMTSIILADCATWALLGCNDKTTAELLEWRGGTATVEVQTVQHDAMEPAFRLAHRNSTGDGQRAIYTSNDIIKTAARNEALLIFQQLDPLKAKAFPIFQHHEFRAKRMPEISADSLIPLSDQKAKDILRKWEAERIRSFRVWLANGGNPLNDYTGFPPQKKGKMNGKPMPDILPLHTLERMALAEAAGIPYDPTTDPDSPQYVPPAVDEDEELIMEEEEEVWELDESAFTDAEIEEEQTTAAQPAPEGKSAQNDPKQLTTQEQPAQQEMPMSTWEDEPTEEATPLPTPRTVDVSDLEEETPSAIEKVEAEMVADDGASSDPAPAEEEPVAETGVTEEVTQKQTQETPEAQEPQNTQNATEVAGEQNPAENEKPNQQRSKSRSRKRGKKNPFDSWDEENKLQDQIDNYKPKTRMEAGGSKKLSDL